MPCPFPGMDPYIERPAIFPDFHDRFITYLSAALRPLLKPRYLPVLRDRLFVVEADRSMYPVVAVVERKRTAKREASAASTAVLAADSAVVFDLSREEIREPLLEIIEPAAGNRVVTAIELLSPDNKRSGDGQESYQAKRENYWSGGANLVEMDLLRTGDLTVRVSEEKLAGLPQWHYLVAVSRHWPLQQCLYAFALERRLPRIALPLAKDDKDITVDLQAVFARCWEEGPYPELLMYDGRPPGRLPAAETAWCYAQLTAAGLRGEAPASGVSQMRKRANGSAKRR